MHKYTPNISDGHGAYFFWPCRNLSPVDSLVFAPWDLCIWCIAAGHRTWLLWFTNWITVFFKHYKPLICGKIMDNPTGIHPISRTIPQFSAFLWVLHINMYMYNIYIYIYIKCVYIYMYIHITVIWYIYIMCIYIMCIYIMCIYIMCIYVYIYNVYLYIYIYYISTIHLYNWACGISFPWDVFLVEAQAVSRLLGTSARLLISRCGKDPKAELFRW